MSPPHHLAVTPHLLFGTAPASGAATRHPRRGAGALAEPLVGYVSPLPGGEGGSGIYRFHMARPWLLPIVTGATGLLGGFLTWKFAPETAGIGTNAAIRAFHRGAKIRFPTAIFKLITSALTIGGGLTSGREGPIAQIGAATGSSIADALKLSAHERNLALAAGLGAGIAATVCSYGACDHYGPRPLIVPNPGLR